MTLDELSKEYEQQYRILCARIESLRPLLCVYTGEELRRLRQRIRTYYSMASDCSHISHILSGYYDGEDGADDGHA